MIFWACKHCNKRDSADDGRVAAQMLAHASNGANKASEKRAAAIDLTGSKLSHRTGSEAAQQLKVY
jgi:hypothetical protein